MEQRIDSNTKPEFAAGTDPAYIPGLTAPAPARTEGDAEKEPEESDVLEEVDGEDDSTAVADEAETPQDAEPKPDSRGKAGEPAESSDKATSADEAEPSDEADGPVFEVSDRRGSIRVAREGVRFRLDDQEAEFDWAEIGAVEVKTGRFGRRFTVTVHLSSRRWFNAEVEAGARSSLKEWTAELDAVLDAYFEEA
ncbi:hypothetical protein ABZS61_31620 [Streptomyces sp. NPDC005566]|uniref:hypothetical protein n=1 Tax=Streptomyces sp. NPDC005566 TaxID=3156886 RepID=UPI0033B65BFD